jgi:hypothetical protein
MVRIILAFSVLGIQLGGSPLQLQRLQVRPALTQCAYMTPGEYFGGCLMLFMLDRKMFIISVFLLEEKKMASQCSGNKNKSRTFVYNFNENERINISSTMLITPITVAARSKA